MLMKNVTLLRGHVSMETAYVVPDYPYGSNLRCQKRYWLETATKGTQRGRVKLMEQTTNPKKGDVWNKPHASTYTPLRYLVRDESNGHVSSYALFPSCEGVLTFLATGLYAQFDEAERLEFAKKVDSSEKTGHFEGGRVRALLAACREHSDLSADEIINVVQLQRPGDHFLYSSTVYLLRFCLIAEKETGVSLPL